MKEKPPKLELRAEHLAITAEGVVLEGDVAAELATWLVQRNALMVKVIRELDPGLQPDDLRVDAAGRVVLRSPRLQRLAFEAVRSGSAPGSARRLGRLVALTGGRIGTRGTQEDSPHRPSESGESGEAGGDAKGSPPPPVRGEAPGSHIDFFCLADGGINFICIDWEPGDDFDVNFACEWGS